MTRYLKSHKNEEENAALQEQLINQLSQQEQEAKMTEAVDEAMSTETEMKPSEITDLEEAKKEVSRNDYLCAFCRFIFATKSGYMEHTKSGNCVQVSVPILFQFSKE